MESSCLGRVWWYTDHVERVVQVFSSFEEADQADLDFYASLSPKERVDMLLDLVNRYRESLGEAASRLERIHRVTEFPPG